MSNASDAKGCWVILVLVVVFAAFVSIVVDVIRPHTIDPSQDSINMVQPSGWRPENDAHYAQEVNVPNSVANLNNGQANYYNDAGEALIIEQYKNDTNAQQKGDMVVGGLMGIAWTVGILFVLGIIVLAIFAPK